MQHRAPAPAINPNSFDITPEEYIAPRFLKKIKGKVVLTTKIDYYNSHFLRFQPPCKYSYRKGSLKRMPMWRIVIW